MTSQVQGGDFNLYEGLRCHGVPLVTISRGRLVCENGVFMCAEGSGKFYPQRTFPDYLYKKMVQREKVCSVCFCWCQMKSVNKRTSCQCTRADVMQCCVSSARTSCKTTHHTVSNCTDLTVCIKDLMLLLPAR